MKTTILSAIALVLLIAPVTTQWPAYPASGVPRTADGQVDLRAPAPRVDGKPDLSGVWRARPDPLGQVGGVENTVFPRYMERIAEDIDPDPTAVVKPEYAALMKKRLEVLGLDDPINRCAPPGALRLLMLAPPLKIVQTPGLVLLLHEKETTFRQVFTDGRPLPADPQPSFMGYSVGRWDGDTLVVTSTGFTEQSRLDIAGTPHSDALRMTERYRRIDTGRLQVDIELSDPKVFKQPITATQHFLLIPDQDLIEYYCTENERSAEHYRAK
jgi:hypothetical protein